jgi:sulfofructose kinase
MSSVIIGQDGDRTIVNRTDPALWADTQVPTASDVSGSGAVLTDVRWLSGALAAASAARVLEIPTVVDWDLTDQAVPDELLDLATHVVFSEPAFEQRFRSISESKVAEVARRHDTVVGVTQGSAGVVWASGGSGHRTNAFGVEAVDTLGAGDVFHGAFALGVARGLDISDIVVMSAAAAAVKCAAGGGREGFPTEADVAALLEE